MQYTILTQPKNKQHEAIPGFVFVHREGNCVPGWKATATMKNAAPCRGFSLSVDFLNTSNGLLVWFWSKPFVSWQAGTPMTQPQVFQQRRTEEQRNTEEQSAHWVTTIFPDREPPS